MTPSLHSFSFWCKKQMSRYKNRKEKKCGKYGLTSSYTYKWLYIIMHTHAYRRDQHTFSTDDTFGTINSEYLTSIYHLPSPSPVLFFPLQRPQFLSLTGWCCNTLEVVNAFPQQWESLSPQDGWLYQSPALQRKLISFEDFHLHRCSGSYCLLQIHNVTFLRSLPVLSVVSLATVKQSQHSTVSIKGRRDLQYESDI